LSSALNDIFCCCFYPGLSASFPKDKW
jgi:hypothetical protein